jgi:hypothetical protein
MPSTRTLLVLALLLAMPMPAQAIDNAGLIDDEHTCQTAGVGVSGPELLNFFRKRTPGDDLRQRIERLLADLDADSFRARQVAASKLVEIGPAALPFLRQAIRGKGLEMTRRSEQCIEEIEKGRNTGLPAAAARLVRARQPEGACPVLLDYVPFAEDPMVEEELLGALAVLGNTAGQSDPALVAALKDPVPARRGAAALAVARLGGGKHQAEVIKLLADPDPKVCLRAAQGLIAAHDKRAVATLLTLVSGAPLDLAVQAEDLLTRVAGDEAPSTNLTDTTNAVRRRCRAAWDKWWQANESKIDLTRADVEILSESAGYRARTLARRFHTALVKGDSAALKQLTDAPYYWFNINDQPDRAALDNFWDKNPHGGLEKIEEMAVVIRGVVSVDEFRKVGTKEAQEFLSRLRKESIRVVYADVSNPFPNEPQVLRVGVLVRVTGQQRVLGVTLITPVR